MTSIPQRLVVVGAGGHGRELLDIIEAINAARPGTWEVLGFVDDGEPDRDLLTRLATTFLGPLEVLAGLEANYVIGVGSGSARKLIDQQLISADLEAASLVHPAALVGSDTAWEPGFVLCGHGSVTTNVRLGRHCHLNRMATIGHDCRIGSYVTINPGSTVSGNVTLGDGVTIGTGASVIQGVTIGAGTTVGAGATVISDLPAGVTAVGVPARPQ